MVPAPLDVRFDTSDTATPKPARPAAAPVVVARSTGSDRSAPVVVKIPPKEMPRGSAPALASPAVQLEPAAASLASGSVVSVVTEDAEPIRAHERRDTFESPPVPTSVPVANEPTAPMKMAPTHDAGRAEVAAVAAEVVPAVRGIDRIRMPRLSKRHVVVSEQDTRSSSSRRRVIGVVALAGTALAATVGALVWMRSSAPQAEKLVEVAHAPTTPSVPSVPSVDIAQAEAPLAEPPTPDVAPAVAPAVARVGGQQTCGLDVRANTDGATLWVDGKRIGGAPAVVPVACNTIANVELRHPRYQTFTQAVAVDAEAPAGVSTLNARLEREKTKLTVVSEPAGAQVTYNGSVVGRTPLVIKVNRYEQGTVWFRAPNHEADWRKIVPSKATKTLSIKLKGVILRPPS